MFRGHIGDRFGNDQRAIGRSAIGRSATGDGAFTGAAGVSGAHRRLSSDLGDWIGLALACLVFLVLVLAMLL